MSSPRPDSAPRHAEPPSFFQEGLSAALPGRRFLAGLLAGVLLCLGGVWLFVQYAQHEVALELERVAGERLTLYSGTLHSALNKYSYLPHILATNPEVQRLVTRGDNTDAVNSYLKDINTASGSMDLFILDREGNTVATSNWDEPGSFAGHKYRYRPYYLDAMRYNRGRYFGVGATTGRPGFFFTQAVRMNPAPPRPVTPETAAYAPDIVGVAVTKVDLSMLQKEWRAGGETVFITDENGIIFLSSVDEWRYRATREMPEQVQADMLSQRQYGNTLPPPLDMRAFQKDGVHRLTVAGQTWLCSTRTLDDYGWTLWFLRPEAVLTERAEAHWLMGLGVVSLLTMLALLIRAFYVSATARREAREAWRIRAVNTRLVKEVRIRKKTERELLAAQDDLLHAGQLAALGQVAASVAHELSQPVTSMRMFISSCRRMAQTGRLEQVETTTGHMMELVQRLESLIGQLKHFARKSSSRPVRVPLRSVLENALTVLRFKLEAVGCVPEVICPEEAAVMADALQLEQVCINLMHNALDALDAFHAPGAPLAAAPTGGDARQATPQGVSGPSAEKRLRIFVEAAPGAYLLSIEDNGPGIDPQVREQIFQPFFTTKKSGEGIGLGLSIVDKIVRSLQGEITVHDVAPHGTRFTIRLLRAAYGTPS